MKSINLEANRINDRTEKIRGVTFQVATSPYLFPERLECEYEESSGEVVITFKYLDDEKGKAKQFDEAVTMIIGKNSGKLLGVRVRVDEHDIDAIRVVVTDDIPKAIDKARKNAKRMRLNYTVAKEAIKKNSEKIAEMVAS